MVPSWLDQPDVEKQQDAEKDETYLAPVGEANRFTQPRGEFTRYINSAGRDTSMARRSIANYVRNSMGGSRNATQRLGVARNSSAKLLDVTGIFASGGVQAVERYLSLENLSKKSATDVLLSIADFVCPDGANSWYWDSPVEKGSRYETFVARELVEYMDKHYPTNPDRSARAITGLSMGGHGAMWLSFRHKDCFGAAGSMSGGVDIRPFSNNWSIASLLGEEEEHRENWEAHTAINQIECIQDGDLALIVDCGYDDFFFEVNNQFHQKLLERGIGHDFYVRPGGHTAEYWSNSIRYHLLFFESFFKQQVAE